MFQLQHIYSGKYVAISNIHTSKTENANMQVLLVFYIKTIDSWNSILNYNICMQLAST